MRDMYEVMDRWGAWAASDNSGVDWQPIAAGFKGLLPHGKNMSSSSPTLLSVSHYVLLRRRENALMAQLGRNCKLQWGLLTAV